MEKELSLEELQKLVFSNKATALQKIAFAKLLNESALAEAQEEKQSKVKLIEDFIAKQGLTVQEFITLKKPVPTVEIIWEWTEENGTKHTKNKGQKGKWSSKDIVKKNLTKEKAMEFAKTPEGKKFVEKLYE
ncbi:hypothetical protein [Comamonas testosteroni]|uniref:hypothetical protein n=1 Tax=Comamonas testosteroni TaxID=285 RepID=UPI0026F33838|nr:hypothetical protein [Comamonas testosteroni]